MAKPYRKTELRPTSYSLGNQPIIYSNRSRKPVCCKSDLQEVSLLSLPIDLGANNNPCNNWLGLD